MKTIFLPCALLGLALTIGALAADVTVTEVPTLEPPDTVTAWTMSGQCVDINDAGVAACKSSAIGPPYRCGWRGSQTCHETVERAVRWDGVAATAVAGWAGAKENPLGISEAGDVWGYVYQGQIYGPDAGRIWRADGSVRIAAGPVRWVDRSGRYVDETATVVGGSTMVYTDVAHAADGTPIPVFGLGGGGFSGSGAQIIGEDGTLAGVQILQASSPAGPTGDEVPEVSGSGWLVGEPLYQRLPRNEDGTLDVYGQQIWPASFARPTGGVGWRSVVADISARREILIQHDATSIGSGAVHASVCLPKGRTRYDAPNGKTYYGRYTCVQGWQGGATGFSGLNDVGDTVGMFQPAFSTQSLPYLWRRDARDAAIVEAIDLDAAVAPSGYRVLRVGDVNNLRRIAATCLTPAGQQRGCILDVRR